MLEEHSNPEKLEEVIDRLLDEQIITEDEEKLIMSRDKITINGVDFVCTCYACPEQYDVYFHDQYIAYVRKRYGRLRAHPVINGEIQWDELFYQEDEDDKFSGVINNREETLAKITHEIKKHILLPK